MPGPTDRGRRYHSGTFRSSSFSHIRASPSEGARQSPRGADIAAEFKQLVDDGIVNRFGAGKRDAAE